MVQVFLVHEHILCKHRHKARTLPWHYQDFARAATPFTSKAAAETSATPTMKDLYKQTDSQDLILLHWDLCKT